METIHIKVPIEIRKALRIRSAELGITMTQLAGEIFAEYFFREIKRANG